MPFISTAKLHLVCKYLDLPQADDLLSDVINDILSAADLKELTSTQAIALIMFAEGDEYGMTSNLADELTYGYGTPLVHGGWQFQLPSDFVYKYIGKPVA